MTIIRPAQESDLEQLANIWLNGWRDAHLAIVPAALARLRTFENFHDRLKAALPAVRVAVLDGAPAGFVMLKPSEVYQFYVAAEARGSGLAGTLMADAEVQLVERGSSVVWLSCAIGNDRAARFYEKCGWHRAGTMVDHAETSEGPFALETWRYEKILRNDGI